MHSIEAWIFQKLRYTYLHFACFYILPSIQHTRTIGHLSGAEHNRYHAKRLLKRDNRKIW